MSQYVARSISVPIPQSDRLPGRMLTLLLELYASQKNFARPTGHAVYRTVHSSGPKVALFPTFCACLQDLLEARVQQLQVRGMSAEPSVLTAQFC